MNRTFSPAAGLSGSLRVPADKSIAHRSFLLGAMARGRTAINGNVAGQDVHSTIDCLRRLGIVIDRTGAHEYVVEGTGWEVAREAKLDAGNSGTTMRLLTGALAGRPGSFELAGDESLSRRPMCRVAEPLRLMGADVLLSDGGRPPIRLTGGRLTGITYAPEVASAQVKGAILLAGAQVQGVTTVEEPLPTRDHTERFLSWLGVPVETSGGRVSITGGDALFTHPGFELQVPGDLSSAAFLLTAAILSTGSVVEVTGVGLNPGRTGILEVFSRMGAIVELVVESELPEPAGRVIARSGPLEGVEVGGATIPRTIDELPLVALAATQAEGTTIIRDAGELRAKESDRLAVLALNLRSLGGQVEEFPDGLCIDGPVKLTGGTVDALGDHRMAMTFALAGLIASGPVTVEGWESADVSFPGFAEILRSLTR
ncbi:MAG: 3-phosphoshikimate 1-carboxyvinyltransferase [Actinomycetota bacterium]